MLEWHWFANRSPEPLLRFLGSRPTENGDGGRGLGRKLRLFTIGCCRRVRHLAPRQAQEALAVFERVLEEAVPTEVLRGALDAARKARENTKRAPGGVSPAARAIGQAGSEGPPGALITCAVVAAQEAEEAAALAAEAKHDRPGDPTRPTCRIARSAERAYQTSLVHDIFGNPFRSVAIEPSWLTSDVRALARGAYEEEAFDRMPILADALQDAGCDNTDILIHLRDPNATHARGCWVLDLILDKS